MHGPEAAKLHGFSTLLQILGKQTPELLLWGFLPKELHIGFVKMLR